MKESAAKFLAFAYCLTLGTYLCALIIEPEYFYHLTVGNWIAAHGDLPRENIWVAGDGKTWVAEHWIFQLFISRVETLRGESGIAIFKLLLCSAVALTLFRLFREKSGDSFFAGIALTFTACGILEGAPLGPALAGWPLLALILTAKFGVTAFLLSALLTNIHPLLALAALVLPWLSGAPRRVEIGAALGALCSPYLGKHMIYSLEQAVRAADFTPAAIGASVENFTFSFLLLSWVMLIILLYGRPRPAPIPRLLAAGGASAIAGLIFPALQPFALLIAGLALCFVWRERAADRPLVISLEGLRSGLARLPAVGLIWVLGVLVFLNIANFYRYPVVDALMPVREMDLLIEKGFPDSFSYEKQIEPYLIYRLSGPDGSPQKKLRRVSPRVAQLAPDVVLAQSKGATFRAFKADSRYRVIKLPPREGEKEEKAPYWTLFQLAIEPGPVL